MAEQLARNGARLRTRDATIIAACGDSYPYHDRKRNVCLDANANVNLLCQAFEHPARIGLTSRHVFMGPDDNDWWNQYYGTFWQPLPTTAILGLGIFNHQHQLVLLTDPAQTKEFPPVKVPKPTADDIRDLYQLTESVSPRHACVAEIGMCLFWAPPAGAPPANDPRVIAIRALIDRINPALFAPRLEQLSQVQRIILVGGGVAKAHAIRHVLDHLSPAARSADLDSLAIQILCTDRSCAQQMLKA
jgi:hypothetical protein